LTFIASSCRVKGKFYNKIQTISGKPFRQEIAARTNNPEGILEFDR
jgi:hypothetical protein